MVETAKILLLNGIRELFASGGFDSDVGAGSA